MRNKFGKQILIVGIIFLVIAEILIGFGFYNMSVSKGEFLELTASLLMGGCATCALSLVFLWVGLKKMFPKHTKIDAGIRILMVSVLVFIAALYFAALALFYFYGHNSTYFSGALYKALLLATVFVVLFIWGKRNIDMHIDSN